MIWRGANAALLGQALRLQRPAYLRPLSAGVKDAYHDKYKTGGVPVVSSAEDFCEGMGID
jgi:hypothetical protein